MLNREEAIQVLKAVSDAGFSCTLSARVGPHDLRDYSVTVALQGVDAARLGELERAATNPVPDATARVEGGYLEVR